jgi:pentatricopeptide repeat protein
MFSSDNYTNESENKQQQQQQQQQRDDFPPKDTSEEQQHHSSNQPSDVPVEMTGLSSDNINPPNQENGNNLNQSSATEPQRPNFGSDYVPGAGPARHAPNSIDHYQRGQEERSNYRGRNNTDYETTHHPGRGGGGGGGGSHYTNQNNNHNNNYPGRDGGGRHHNQYNRHYNPGGRGNNFDRGDRNSFNNKLSGDRPRFSGSNNNNDDPWNQQQRENRPTILQGLDINALVDRLISKLNNKEAVFADLDRTRIDNRNVFDSGKALTALISIAARRKNIGLGHAAWDWMDHAGIAKNTFHYNSMISVTEKARDYQYALALLQEMKDRNIKKNEVTYVHFLLLLDCIGPFVSCNWMNHSFVFCRFCTLGSQVLYPHVKNAGCGKKRCIC